MTFGRALVLATALWMAGCGAAVPPAAVESLRPEVLAEIPHDPSAWTQGFEIADGTLYEGTGRVGASQLRELDPDTGALVRSAPLPDGLYGEGISPNTGLKDGAWDAIEAERTESHEVVAGDDGGGRGPLHQARCRLGSALHREPAALDQVVVGRDSGSFQRIGMTGMSHRSHHELWRT